MENQAVLTKSKSTMGETVLFWLGVAYMLVLVCAMTPLTHQLDDIKIGVLHGFGPILTIVYLLFLAFGQVRAPRKGLILTLGAYYVFITITTLTIHDFRKWLAWEGLWMQWALLGPFLAFMGSVCNKSKNYQVVMFLALLTCLTTVFGLAHRGMYGMESGATLIANAEMGDIGLLRGEYFKIEKELIAEIPKLNLIPDTDPTKIKKAQALDTKRRKYVALGSELRQQSEVLSNSFAYKIFSTLSGAKSRMMSLILNRNFYASFLLLMLPFVIAGIGIVPPVPWKIFAWMALFVVMVCIILDVTTGALTKMIPGSILGISMMLLCIPLLMAALPEWLGKKNGLFALFGFVIVFGLGLYFIHNKEMNAAKGDPVNARWFILAMLPLAGYALWTLVHELPLRVACLVTMALGVVLLFLDTPVGGALFIFAPMVTVALMKVPAVTWRIGMGATLVMGLFCLYYTKSKVSTFICFELEILLMVVMWWFASRQRLRVKGGIVIGVLGIVLLAVAIFFITPAGIKVIGSLNEGFVMEQMKDFGNPLNSRRVIWTGAWGIWKDHPILGAGLKSFLVLFPEYRQPDYFLYEISHVTIFAHCFFLDVLAESGMLGFVSLMAFLAFMYLKATKRALREIDWRDRMVAICTIGGVTGFFLSNLTSPNARWPICAGVIWAVLGVMAGIINRRMGSEKSEKDVHHWVPSEKGRMIILALALLSVGGWGYTLVFAIDHFKGSMRNNEGLQVLGNPPVQKGMLSQTRQATIDNYLKFQAEQDPKKKGQLFEQFQNSKNLYNKYRNMGLALFTEALEFNPHFITSYYKKASIESMGVDPTAGPKAEDLLKALRTYEELRQYAPDFSQVRFNLALLNAQMVGVESRGGNNPVKIAKYENEALQNYREAASRTIEWVQTEHLITLLVKKGRTAKWEFTETDISNFNALGKIIKKGKNPVAQKMKETLEKSNAVDLSEAAQSTVAKTAIVAELNRLRLEKNLYTEDLFDGIELTKRTMNRINRKPTGVQLEQLNRSLLVQAFPELVKPHPYDEACEAAARIFYWWNRLFVDDVRVRRSESQVMSYIWKTALIYMKCAISTKHYEEATDVVMELNGLPGAMVQLGQDSVKSEDRFALVISQMVSVMEQEKNNEELGKFLQAVVENFPINENARFRYAINLFNREKPIEAKNQAAIYKKLFPQKEINMVYLDFRIAKAEGNDAEAAKAATLFFKSASDPALNMLKLEVRNYMNDQVKKQTAVSKEDGLPAPKIPAPKKTPTPVK